jgi:hypothetical protein
MRKSLSLLFCLSLLLGAVSSVRAQGQDLSYANLYVLDYSGFPAVTGLADVFDAQGIFASGLPPEAVTVLEDGAPYPLDSLNEISVPMQLAIAVNQGKELGTRDNNGFSRFQRVAQVLAQWAQSRPADLPDDYSLVSQAGPVLNHASAADFIAGLGSFSPEFNSSTPNLLSLSIALDTVLAQTPRYGMKRAILFITPHMDDPATAETLAPLIKRAVDNKVHVFVWFVDVETTFATTSAAAFNSLAIETGGTMFKYSGTERFPDPEVYFSPLRRVYSFTYTSRLKSGGEHNVALKVKLPSGELDSNPQTVNLDIQPPNPIPVTSASQITRQAPTDDPFNQDALQPVSQELDIIIEFPDGHKRPLARTTLYVDGKVMDENTAEPFDKFTWDLSTYTSTAEHQIVIEAVDNIGLSKQSMPIPVTVTVIQPPSGPAAFLARYRIFIAVGAVIFAGFILFVILLGGRLRGASLKTAQEARRVAADPLTQPIKAVMESKTTPLDKNKKPRILPGKQASDAKSKKEAASFIRLTPDGQPAAASPISILEREITFGTDPVQCNQILDDPSISSVHARLRQTDDGGFLLLDNNSIAGTWVNYEPVPREGYRLMHGDMVNFGQLSFRFTLYKVPETVRPKITPQPEE